MLKIYIDGRWLKQTVAKPNSDPVSNRVLLIAAYNSHKINLMCLNHTEHRVSSSEHMDKARHDLIPNLWKSSGDHGSQGGERVKKQ